MLYRLVLVQQADDRPAVRGGMIGKHRVRIDGDRVSDAFEQWQVVVRVAVEPGAVRRSIVFRQPRTAGG